MSLTQVMDKGTATLSRVLEPKPFMWDRIIFYLATTLFGLSASGYIIELLKSYDNPVACLASSEDQAEYTYINNYCRKHLPVAEYFPVALTIHATALVIPHYLWRGVFSAQFDSFFIHAAKIETLREADTGKYPQMNFSIVDYLKREFGDTKVIFTVYVAKLILQFLLVLISLVVNAVVFIDIDSNIMFECSDDKEGNHVFGNVTCVYPKKLFINVLEVFDYILLVAAMILICFGLYWCLLYDHNYSSEENIAKFCYDSCISAKYYKKPLKAFLSCNWYQIKNDFDFLLASLLATNSGHRGVFKVMLVENLISKSLYRHMELLAKTYGKIVVDSQGNYRLY